MKINSIGLEAFMSIDQAAIELPDRGLVMVTGDNGQGKSTLIESVAAAFWGKTLRGTPWWRDGVESSVEIESPTLSLRRVRKGTKNKVTLLGGAVHDTATKAQDHIDRSMPSVEVWRKTCVFTSAAVEGAQFTSGADGDRKRLLEAVLGIDKFDVALDGCRADLKKALETIERQKHAHEIATVKMENEDRRKDEAAARARDFKMPDKPPLEEAKRLGELISKFTPEIETLRKQERSLVAKSHRLGADLRSARDRHERLNLDQCPTCAQPIPKELRAQLAGEVAALAEEFAKLNETMETDIELIREQMEELDETVRAHDLQRRELIRAAENYKKLIVDRDALQKAVSEAVLASTRYLLEKTNASAAITRATKEQRILEAVVDVLGLKGVRASVLAHTLLGLEGVANKWLGKMQSDVRIALRPYTEKKTGGVSDSIGISIEGAGAGHGYGACSQGQRRRVDVALVLALATLAQAAGGAAESTVFFDEVFDVLDEQGALGVASALDELANERCVVVISHASPLQKALPAKLHLRVESGRVIEV